MKTREQEIQEQYLIAIRNAKENGMITTLDGVTIGPSCLQDGTCLRFAQDYRAEAVSRRQEGQR